MTDEQLKDLEFIQNVITWMNTNSFQIKSSAVILVSALLAICASTKNDYFVRAAVFAAVVLWFLDAYYLCKSTSSVGSTMMSRVDWVAVRGGPGGQVSQRYPAHQW